MARKIQVRRGTAANMPVLADGELGLQTDTGKLYIGCAGANVEVAMGAELINAIAGCAPASHTHTAAQVGLGNVDNISADQIRRGGGKHLAGQGASNGYSFLGDGAEDTGMFSDSDGDLYFLQNGAKYSLQDFRTPDGSKSVNYANSANYANTAGNANALGGVGAGEFYRSNNKPFVIGSYMGNGSNQFINLGFTPSAVLIGSELRGFGSAYNGRSSGGLAATNVPVLDDSRQLAGHQIVIEITNGGFTVHYNTTPYANDSGDYYNYVAFK